jgi:hypothetical protein
MAEPGERYFLAQVGCGFAEETDHPAYRAFLR